MNIRIFKTDGLSRLPYLLTLLGASLLVFAIFVRPVKGIHSGLNHYYRSKFLDMVNGEAYRPFVCRTLLPTTIRIISAITPAQTKKALAEAVQDDYILRSTFESLLWETSAAYEYIVASILMILCFVGFAHIAVQLTLHLCPIRQGRYTRLWLAAGVLLGLPPFFRYTSYLYDAPQLLLFTLALYFLAKSQLRAFIVTFIFCCLNKETAVLLILLFAVARHKAYTSAKQYWGMLLGLVFSYAGLKSVITLIFSSNPGSFLDFHLDHNLQFFTRAWNFNTLMVFLIVVALLFYGWQKKPLFLRQALLCTLPPLLALALFFGYFDEWRGYYEAYSIAFALIVDSLARLKNNLSLAHKEIGV